MRHSFRVTGSTMAVPFYVPDQFLSTLVADEDARLPVLGVLFVPYGSMSLPDPQYLILWSEGAGYLPPFLGKDWVLLGYD